MAAEGDVLIGEWHPVMLSQELGEQPKAVQILGYKAVVFRTAEGVHAFQDLCIHRGVPLSLGTVKGDELVCAYHGWTYDRCGACTRIPSMPEGQSIPAKARAVVYRCLEEHGFIWVCVGEPARTHPPVAEHIKAGYRQVRMGPYELQAAGPRVVENFLDVSHLMFVHEGLLGDGEHTEIPDYRVHAQDGMLRSDEIAVYQPDPDGRGRGMNSHYVYEVFGPLTASLTKRNPETGEAFQLFLMVLPVTEHSSKAFMLMQRNYDLEEQDDVFIEFQNRLIEQDLAIVENQKPELLPLDLQAELHLRSDRMSIAYRQSLRESGVTFGTA